MRSKLLLGVAAPAIAALTLATTSAPASARWGAWGWGGAALAAGVIGGAAIAAAATSPYYGYGYPAYGYGYPAYSYGYGPGYYGPGYGYGYSYGPTVSYGYGYGPGYWGGAYGSVGPTVVRRHTVRRVARY
jgi:hypothetical protein